MQNIHRFQRKTPEWGIDTFKLLANTPPMGMHIFCNPNIEIEHVESKIQRKLSVAAIAISCTFLTACGGGGGGGAATGSPIVASTLAFPLLQAMRTARMNGGTTTLYAVGTADTESTDGLCSGTQTSTDAPAVTSAIFESASALAAFTTTTTSYTNCTPSSNVFTGTSYYNGNLDQVGFVTTNEYRVYTIQNIPTKVTVGDVGVLGSESSYTSGDKNTLNFRRDMSFVVEADTANTAVVNVISKFYFPNSTGTMMPYCGGIGSKVVVRDNLYQTTQVRQRIDINGGLTLVSIDQQSVDSCSTVRNTSKRHYVWRSKIG